MSKPTLIKSLAKVIISAAWADGEVSNEEINSLKDLLFQMPEMTARDWAELEIYLDAPVNLEERERLIAELAAAMRTPRDRALAISRLEEIIAVDGNITEKERALVAEIKSALEGVNVSVFGQLGHLLGRSLQRRKRQDSDKYNRERYIDDFIKNKVFYSLKHKAKIDANAFELPEDELRKLSLAGGLMAQVAFVDRDISPSEVAGIAQAIQKSWGVSAAAAATVAEVAAAEISKQLDLYRLAREFFESTTESERLAFLEALFAVAASDGSASHEEIEAIRLVAKLLKLTHKQFISAKLKLPRAKRAS